MTTAQDIKNQIAYARAQGEEKGMQEGIQKGMQEGIEKGMEKERLTIAKNLKAARFSIESIVHATGLSPEQVETL